jgi:hypothetical protein
MKAPSFSPAAAGAFLINHGEKLVVGLFCMFALLMMWWGISATQVHGVDRSRTPEALENLARQAAANMDSSATVPREKVPRVDPMAPRVDPWRPQQVKLADPPARSLLFDRPMYAELTKRTKPEVFPITDLRAVAGIAVFTDPTADARRGVARPRQPIAPPEQAPPPTRTPSRRAGRGTEQPEAPHLTGEFDHGSTVVDIPPDEQVGPGKIAPFVVVTGLIPAGKQIAEFESRFASASFRDPRRDTPRWADYIVERTRVVPGATPRWERMRLVNVSRLNANPGGVQPGPAAADQGGPPLHAENLPPGFFLQPGETEVEYAAALPARVDGPWGEEALHPWFVPEIRERIEKGLEQPGNEEPIPSIKLADIVAKPATYVGKKVRLAGVVLDTDSKVQKSARLHRFGVRTPDEAVSTGLETIGEGDDLVFATSEEYGGRLAFDLTKPRNCNLLVRVDQVGSTPVARLLEIEFVDDEGEITDTRKDPAQDPVVLADGPNQGGGGLGGHQQPGAPAVDLAANRLFRFVDLGVVPGAEYRYRVRFAIRNPNVNLAPQHVADVAITKGDFLLADYSPETSTVRIPDPVRILARTIPRDAARKLKVKGDTVELIVMAKSGENGNYGLRSVVTPPGGSANVDPALNRPAAKLHFGEPVTTDRLLLDVRGGQEERTPTRGKQQPAEPLEVLLLRPDGEYDVVTAADSERLIRRYRSTLFAPGDDLPLDLKP